MVTMGEWWAEVKRRLEVEAERQLDAERRAKRPDTTGYWCMVASTEGHQHCKRKPCDCPCHLPANRSGDPKRPHSYPREDWRRLSMSRRRDLVRQRR